jgi:hypothetical protein
MKLSAIRFVILSVLLLALSTGALAATGYTDVTLTTFTDLRIWGAEEILPVVVQNNAPYEQSYLIQIDDSVGRWGTYRIEPSATFSLAPGEKHETYLLLKADNNDFIGVQKFDMTLFSNNGDQRTIRMSANLLKPVEEKSFWPLLLAFFIIACIGIIIIVVAVLLIRLATRPKKEEDMFEDFDDFLDDEPQKNDEVKEDEFNEFDDFDDFDIFDDAESDRGVDKKRSSGEEFY